MQLKIEWTKYTRTFNTNYFNLDYFLDKRKSLFGKISYNFKVNRKWKKREMLRSKLNKIKKWCLYCFMIFYYSKVNDIKKPTVSVGFTDSQIYNFAASNSVILHEYLVWKREKREKERQTWLLKKLIWQICSTNFFNG